MKNSQITTKSSSKKSANSWIILDYTLVILLSSISIFLIAVGIIYLFSRFVLTTGTVAFGSPVDCVNIGSSGNLFDCSFTVRYKVVNTQGKLQLYYVKVDNAIGPKIKPGDVVYLQYDPEDPTIVVYGNTSFRTLGLLYLAIGSLLSLISVYYWSNIKNKYPN